MSKLKSKPLVPKGMILPALYSQEDTKDPLCFLRFYNILNPNQSWYLMEYDPEEGLAFGWVTLGFGPSCDELGYFSIKELEDITSTLIDRDLSWLPLALSEVKKLGC